MSEEQAEVNYCPLCESRLSPTEHEEWEQPIRQCTGCHRKFLPARFGPGAPCWILVNIDEDVRNKRRKKGWIA